MRLFEVWLTCISWTTSAKGHFNRFQIGAVGVKVQQLVGVKNMVQSFFWRNQEKADAVANVKTALPVQPDT